MKVAVITAHQKTRRNLRTMRQRRLQMESLEKRQLLAVDFVNYTPVGEINYLYQTDVDSSAGNEETFRIQAKQTGMLTVWSENVNGGGALDVALYPATNPSAGSPLASATSGERKITINATAGDEYFMHLSAQGNVQNTKLHVSNLVIQSGSTATLNAPEPRVQQEVKGPNVTRVEYLRSDGGTGIFQQTGAGTWMESNTVDSGTASFTERLSRDEWSVYLERSDGFLINLDLFRGQVENATSNADIYTITRTESVNVSNLSYLTYLVSGNAGSFFETSPGQWGQITSGGINATWMETSRTGSIVSLTRNSNTTVELDLSLFEVRFTSTEKYPIGTFLDSSGFTVNSFTFSNGQLLEKTLGNEWITPDNGNRYVESTVTGEQIVLQQISGSPTRTLTLNLRTGIGTNSLGGSVSLYGTDDGARFGDALNGSHVYEANASRSNHWVEINDLRYDFPASTFSTINVLGGGGFDRVTAEETGGNDTVAAQSTTLQLSSPSYIMTFTEMEDTTTIYSGGNDTVTLFDRGNAADHFFSNQTAASVTSAILYGLDNSYRNAVVGFPNIGASRSTPQAGDAGDVAIMRDGPASGDTMNVTPGTATMTYGNGIGSSTATGYNTVHTYSDNGTDTVNIADTTGDDTFYADQRVNHTNDNGANRKGFAFLFNQNSTLFFAGGYQSANSTASTGNDTAILNDDLTQDQFTVTPTSIRMVGGSNSFDNMATGFDNNYGYSQLGPNNDTATYLDSPGNDTFVVGSFNAWMQYQGVTSYVTGFYNTTVNSTSGGVDIANMFDSPSNDTLTTYANSTRVDFRQGFVSGANWANGYTVNSFESVFATKTLGGTDVATLDPFGQSVTTTGGWT